jgi:hypothetical protein
LRSSTSSAQSPSILAWTLFYDLPQLLETLHELNDLVGTDENNTEQSGIHFHMGLALTIRFLAINQGRPVS